MIHAEKHTVQQCITSKDYQSQLNFDSYLMLNAVHVLALYDNWNYENTLRKLCIT